MYAVYKWFCLVPTHPVWKDDHLRRRGPQEWRTQIGAKEEKIRDAVYEWIYLAANIYQNDMIAEEEAWKCRCLVADLCSKDLPKKDMIE